MILPQDCASPKPWMLRFGIEVKQASFCYSTSLLPLNIYPFFGDAHLHQPHHRQAAAVLTFSLHLFLACTLAGIYHHHSWHFLWEHMRPIQEEYPSQLTCSLVVMVMLLLRWCITLFRANILSDSPEALLRV